MAEAKTFKSTAFMIMVSVLLSRILGFVRTALIPIRMGGLSDVADAYNAAFQISDLMYGLLVGGAIAASLIPILTGFIEKKQERQGWLVVGSFINIMMIIMFFLSLLGVIFAPQLMSVIARGFLESPEKMQLTVKLTRILIPIAFFMMLSGFCNGILNSYSKFTVAAFGPVVYNLASVISIYLLSNPNPENNYGVTKVAVGIVFCALLYFVFQLLFTIKFMKKNYSFFIDTHHPEFSKLVKLAVPSLLTSTLMQVNIIVSKSYTTFFDTGSITALELANKTWQMPLGIIAQSIGVAMLPAMSALYARKKHMEISEKLNTSIRFVLFLGIPSAGAMAILSRTIIQFLFNFQGSLSDQGVRLTASLLVFYSIALIMQCLSTIMNRAYYSTKNSFIPFVSGALAVVINLLLAYYMTSHTQIGVVGIPLAFSVASGVNTIILVYLFRRRIKEFKFMSLMSYFIKTTIITLIMMLVLYLSENSLLPYIFKNDIFSLSKMMQGVWVLIQVVAGTAVYFFFSYMIDIKEAKDIIRGGVIKLKSIAKI